MGVEIRFVDWINGMDWTGMVEWNGAMAVTATTINMLRASINA